MAFVPERVEVRVGDVVRWTNEDLVPHTATAGSKVFDSATLEPKATFEWVATGPGEIPYECLIHDAMKGTVIVR